MAEDGVLGAAMTGYTVAEAAALLGITESAVRKRVERGDLEPLPTRGGRLRIDAASVEDERRRLLERLDAGGLAERDRLTGELEGLRRELDDVSIDRQRLKGALESLLQAHAALRDTVAQLIAEQRVVD
ncbi:MAG: helix-turn-helix domain-containing protein [Acidimicrobiia bacterium]